MRTLKTHPGGHTHTKTKLRSVKALQASLALVKVEVKKVHGSTKKKEKTGQKNPQSLKSFYVKANKAKKKKISLQRPTSHLPKANILWTGKTSLDSNIATSTTYEQTG